MKKVTEQLILSLAPNPAAAANGKKISNSGGFAKLYRSADDTPLARRRENAFR